ncbi:MAG: SIS domain-containing protein, partial [Nostocoides sp.]
RDIFADPFLDAPAAPRLGLLMIREPLPDPVDGRVPELDALRHNLAQAVVEEARAAGVTTWEQVTLSGPPLVRVADQIAFVDFTATYLAIGLGLDPAGSAHVAALRDRTR